MNEPAWISLNHADIGYGTHVIVPNAHLKIAPHEWVTILGPNGSGKSSLLKCLLGELAPLRGSRSMTKLRMGYVSQKFTRSTLLPITVAEFLALSELRPTPELQSFRSELIAQLQLDEILKQSFAALSGGQMQRALLAFALWEKPQILFLDEYLEGLDPNFQESVVETICHYFETGPVSVIEVSHNTASVFQHSTRVILLSEGIVFDGSPQDKAFHVGLQEIYPLAYLKAHSLLDAKA